MTMAMEGSRRNVKRGKQRNDDKRKSDNVVKQLPAQLGQLPTVRLWKAGEVLITSLSAGIFHIGKVLSW
jgi:hypothetical protein